MLVDGPSQYTTAAWVVVAVRIAEIIRNAERLLPDTRLREWMQSLSNFFRDSRLLIFIPWVSVRWDDGLSVAENCCFLGNSVAVTSFSPVKTYRRTTFPTFLVHLL